jgi:hypothetical protein
VVSITICCLERLDIVHIWLSVFPSGDVQVNLWLLRCRNIVLLAKRFLYMAKFTTLTPLSLPTLCKLSFPIVWFENVLPTYFDIKISWQNFHVIFTVFIEYTFQFLVEAVHHIINFILNWSMNIQNNDITPANS